MECTNGSSSKGISGLNIGYFLYVDGQHLGYDGMIDEDPSMATMKFKTAIIEYQGNDDWVEAAILERRDPGDGGAARALWRYDVGIFKKTNSDPQLKKGSDHLSGNIHRLLLEKSP